MKDSASMLTRPDELVGVGDEAELSWTMVSAGDAGLGSPMCPMRPPN